MAIADEPIEKAPEFQPAVPHTESPPEFTLVPIVTGAALGIIFAASSLYLVLKVGMTVSASIPVAVVAITLSRFLWKRPGQTAILQNNIVQTTGSAGESIAFGVGVTMPALLLLGFDMTLPRVMVVSLLGGTVGILAMIPLRRAMIVRMHRELAYPEGRAAAMVLKAGEAQDAGAAEADGRAVARQEGTSSAAVFGGFGLAFLHKFITEGMALLKGTVSLPLPMIHRTAALAHDMASELLGVGYIIGLRTAAIMMAGAVLGYLVIIPLLGYIGSASETPVPPGKVLIGEMDTTALRNNYLLFIGAGTVATAGIISMLRTMPMIVKSVLDMTRTGGGAGGPLGVRRTDRDMSMGVVLFGVAALIVALAAFLMTEVPWYAAIAGAGLVIVFGFLFVTVSARLTGEIGSSSNPISGMTVATLTMTCLIFLALGWTSSRERVLALSIAAVVCVAASNGGTTAQSLKTGYLVGATPLWNQYAILIGAVSSALVIGATLLAFNASGTVYSSKAENLPSVTLTPDELARLTGPPEAHGGEEFKVWDTRRDTFKANPRTGYTPREEVARAELKDAHYLVEPATGKVRYLRDDTIMGKLTERDDGRAVKRDFDAPKTQVMGIIINGVLSKKLNWSLILIGALIAVVLEMCGVSALAFAVGVYVPMSVSAPIFVGGLVRFAVDRYRARRASAAAAAMNLSPAEAEAEAIRRSETSPGTLLAAGYIAGGSLAGMLIAFTFFSDTLPETLSQWQYGRTRLETTTPVDRLVDDPSLSGEERKERTAELRRLNKGEIARWAPVKKGTKVRLPKGKLLVAEQDSYLGDIARTTLDDKDRENDEQVRKASLKLLDLNREELIPHVKVPANTTIRLADYSYYHVKNETTLRDLSEKELKSHDDPAVLLERNEMLPNRLENEGKEGLSLPAQSPDGIARLDPAKELPAGAVLKLPQPQWPAVAVFAGLVVALGIIGSGVLRREA